MTSTFQRARSAVTGRWVSLKYALRHPRHTIVQTITRRNRR